MRRILIFGLLIALVGCKNASYHLDQFHKKGGKITPEVIKDSIPYAVKGEDGKDSLIYVPFEVKVDCPEVPKTNSQTRQEERTKRKELETALEIEKSKNKVLEKQLKEQGKTDRKESDNSRKIDNTKSRNEQLSFKGWLMVIGALFIGIIIGWLLNFLISKFK